MRFYVDYEDTGSDLCHVWVEADSKEEAINRVKQEYWNVDKIITIHK